MAKTKLEPGKTDLATVWPDIAAEAVGWDTTAFTAGSGKKQKWKCKLGHVYAVEIKYRTGPNKQGCPYCSGNKVLKGFNDFATLYPEQAQEAHGWDPAMYSHGSKQKKE